MEWSHRTGITALCQVLDVTECDYRLARSQIDHIYVEKPRPDSKSGKVRQLCYPPETSMLYAVQGRLKDRVLNKLVLLPEVRGYRKKSHNINTAADVCGPRALHHREFWAWVPLACWPSLGDGGRSLSLIPRDGKVTATKSGQDG